MIQIVDGWIQHPSFIRRDGHPEKVYSQRNSGENGLACHSVVGEESDFADGIPNRFLLDERLADGSFTANAAASCMFILRKRAKHVQMYPLSAATWTSGGRDANTTTWAMEAEGGMLSSPGGYSEPLTRHQEDGFLVIAAAWKQIHPGRGLVPGTTVWAHWQLAAWFGTAPTACESGRYANAWARLGELEDGMSPADEKRLNDAIEQMKMTALVAETVSAVTGEVNNAVVKRMAIIHVASGTDDAGYPRMLAAYDALKEKGLVP